MHAIWCQRRLSGDFIVDINQILHITSRVDFELVNAGWIKRKTVEFRRIGFADSIINSSSDPSFLLLVPSSILRVLGCFSFFDMIELKESRHVGSPIGIGSLAVSIDFSRPSRLSCFSPCIARRCLQKKLWFWKYLLFFFFIIVIIIIIIIIFHIKFLLPWKPRRNLKILMHQKLLNWTPLYPVRILFLYFSRYNLLMKHNCDRTNTRWCNNNTWYNNNNAWTNYRQKIVELQSY